MKSTLRALSILTLIFGVISAFAGAPTASTFQTRISTPSGAPLEASSVNFRFTTLDSLGTCILYVEEFSNINMGGTGGIVVFTLGQGTKVYPSSPKALHEVFDNTPASMPCQAGGNYTPGLNDRRQIVMQFNDGSGWQTVPQMAVNSVFYANYATRADSLGGFTASDYLRPSTLPSCSSKQTITFNGTSFVCSDNQFASGGNSVSADTTIGLSTNFNLNFITNNTNRLTIAKNGSVGIGTGTSTPNGILDINGTFAGSGTFTATSADTTVVGVGTKFTTELSVGDMIRPGPNDTFSEQRTVVGISSDTTLSINSPMIADVAGTSYYIRRKTNLGEGNSSLGGGGTPIHSGAAFFPNAVPKFEVVTGKTMYYGYNELVTIRHENLFSTAVNRQLGLMLKLSNESNANESNKSGGLIIESSQTYGNSPSLSMVNYGARRLTILYNGRVGIGTTTPQAMLDVNGHIANSDMGVPVVSSCGTSPTISGNDTRGTVTMGTGTPTSCTVTFASAFGAAPVCVITPKGDPGSRMWLTSTSTSNFVVGLQTGAASKVFTYICMQ